MSFAKKEKTAQLNGLFSEDDLRSLLEGNDHLAVFTYESVHSLSPEARASASVASCFCTAGYGLRRPASDFRLVHTKMEFFRTCCCVACDPLDTRCGRF